ncbi:MAG: FoF1 ATP synthase subunit a [Dehalococcoidia bacterium]|nr:FoF1 ATP synthase subunit a [Dehalococcoidia bacterium]MDP7083879.1 FoF1 ATP synthase subunit a [Dehalococcoidia bacterium]MDP7200995.1 FoF1 ATP synthase subunit a [Dehalococcoidia bacterium]MDP7510582.1 FoF1 ATP synthase subunit a [Dehalococcoidia bacterium]HJN87040.1 FoF1 ATP synthase subunit a [Dehalococcoidia bacterium]
MPSGTVAKKLLVVVGLGMVALLVAGFTFGAIGSAMFGTDQFLDKPEIHLPPQPVFPSSTRDEHLGLTDTGAHDGEASEDAAEEAHSKPLGMTQFAVTNTLLASWFATLVIILFFVMAARKKSLVPGRFQGLVEVLFEALLGFCSSVLGSEMAKKAFPIVATIFFFVLFNAWLALLPFYQFLGFVVDGDIKAHLLRSAGTDLNMPLALALVSFVFVEYWGLRAHKFAYLKKFFALGNLLRGKPMGLIDAFVGFLELTSELVRVVSFTFRLFGNMTAGEILVVMITFLVPFVATQFVFGLELLVGLIQSVIFASLTVVFLSVAVRHEEH